MTATALSHSHTQRRKGLLRRVLVIPIVTATVAASVVFPIRANVDAVADPQALIKSDALVPKDCADPFLYETPPPTLEYLFCTHSGMEVRVADDIAGLRDALPLPIFTSKEHPTWAHGSYWAPKVWPIDGRYLMLFSATIANGDHVLGAAWADQPTGPYTAADQPLLTLRKHDLIDPSLFTAANGRTYLYYKESRHNHAGTVLIMGVEVTTDAIDGLQLIGLPQEMIRADQPFEHGTVEGPTVIQRGDQMILFYQAGDTTEPDYSTATAIAPSPLGPFTKDPLGPILHSSDAWSGTGGGTVVPGRNLLLSHGFPTGPYLGQRYPLAYSLDLSGKWPRLTDGPAAHPLTFADLTRMFPPPPPPREIRGIGPR